VTYSLLGHAPRWRDLGIGSFSEQPFQVVPGELLFERLGYLPVVSLEAKKRILELSQLA